MSLLKPWTWGKPKTDVVMARERKLHAQVDEKSARGAEREAKDLLARESSKIDEAKKIVSDIIRILAGGRPAFTSNISALRKQTAKLKKLSMSIGGYVGMSSNLTEKVERRLDPSLQAKYSTKLETIRNKLLELESDVSSKVADLVEVCKDAQTLDPAKAKSLANGINTQFSQVLKFSEGLVVLDGEIHEDLETARKS